MRFLIPPCPQTPLLGGHLCAKFKKLLNVHTLYTDAIYEASSPVVVSYKAPHKYADSC